MCEKYNVITDEIKVNRDKYDILVVQSNILLNEGTLKFEIINPKNVTVKSGEIVNNESFTQKYEFKPIKGKWIVKYYINKNTDGIVKIDFKSMDATH